MQGGAHASRMGPLMTAGPRDDIPPTRRVLSAAIVLDTHTRAHAPLALAALDVLRHRLTSAGLHLPAPPNIPPIPRVSPIPSVPSIPPIPSQRAALDALDTLERWAQTRNPATIPVLLELRRCLIRGATG